MAWQNNGYAAGTDNSVAGGQGGFVAYAQPPVPTNVIVVPESWGQYGPLNFTYTSGGLVNFIINNPGGSR